ncbi:MAG: ABC transporter permease [Pyrinomonadaceae bacterium]
MQTYWQDLRYGLHMLWKNPGFTAIAVLTLALGIGANTALFSVVDAVLLKKLPVKNPEQLVLFNSIAKREVNIGAHDGNVNRDPASGLSTRSSFPYLTYTRLRQQRGALSDVVAFGSVDLNMNVDGQADVAAGQAVSGNYFEMLGVTAFLGRMINESDDNAAATPVAVLSHRYWLRRFGENRQVIGRQVNINNVAFTIAGIAPPGFEGTMNLGSTQDVYIPVTWEPQVAGDRSEMKGAGIWWLRLMGRLKPGTTVEQARASLEPAFQQSVLEHRTLRSTQLTADGQSVLPPLDAKDYPHLGAYSGSQGEMNVRRFYQRPLRLLFGVVGLVLLIACANVANLHLVRASSRQKEIAVRLAMGASRWRLIRQLLTESVLLGLVGGATGILFAWWIKDSLIAVADWNGRDSALNPQLDIRVLGFTLGLSLLTSIVFGLVPAFRTTRVNLTPALKDSGRSSTRASRSLLTRSLVVAQVSLSLLLLIGAGLLVRTLLNLEHVDTGFNSSNLLLFRVEPNLIGYKEDRLANLYQQMTERIEAIPGVNSVTFSRVALLSFSSSSSSLFLPGVKANPDGGFSPSGNVHVHRVRENFLQAMGIPLLTGRSLSAQDDARSPHVAVVNQTFAHDFFPNENPVGKYFSLDPRKPGDVQIIGVARDAKYTSQRDEIPATVYFPWRQYLNSVGGVTFEVRTQGHPGGAIAQIREAVRQIDSNLPLKDFKTQIEQADESLAIERLFAKLLSLFGVLAQQLASIGLYGVLAWSVSQRTREIGIRMALGADRHKVMRMILRQGMTLALIGMVLGAGSAFVLTKYLESLTTMLYGVKPRDPLTYVVTASVLIVISLIACFVPARRATRIDPMVALRYE